MRSKECMLNLKRYRFTAVVLLLLIMSFTDMAAQSSFRKLSRPEKCWVVFHPLRALKARKVTRIVQLVVDSVKVSGVIGQDNNGGRLDAFKHAYWMGMLAAKIGQKQALKLGKAHEKGNYQQFEKHLLEDTLLPDSVSSVMDLKNNEIGASVGCRCKCSSYALKESIIQKLKDGALYIIEKDQGNYLDCSGNVIDMKVWIGKWGIPKCLVSSKKN